MPRRLLIAPSILSADFAQLGTQIHEVEAAGADWIHVDVMDGHFAPNLSMGPVVVEACRRVTRLPLDVHLMVEQPARFLEPFARAGADHLTVHIESDPRVDQIVRSIRELGLRAGVSLNPSTPPEALAEVLPLVDVVLVMSVNPGYSGQQFLPESLERIAELRRLLPRKLIQVDGGITLENIRSVREAGADLMIAGSSVFADGDLPHPYLRLLRALA